MTARHPHINLRISVHDEDKNLFVIESFSSVETKKGYGTKAMKELIFIADLFAVTMTVHPQSAQCYEDQDGPDQYALEEWFENHGFRWQDVELGNGRIVHGMFRFPEPYTDKMNRNTREWEPEIRA